MALSSLSARLHGLPYVLAGPILRRVTPKSVTVWVALRKKASVTLTVKDDKNDKAASGSRDTVAIGANLHIVAVTAYSKPGKDLKENTVYQYDLDFGSGSHLADATQSADLAYAGYQFPSFALPPTDLNSLRLFHGSCRMPHGRGADALSILDDLIRITALNAAQRPHQLLLTGDQIYADDVAASLLMLLMDASNTLLGTKPADVSGWKGEETLPAGLPVGGPAYHPHIPSDFPPLTRRKLLGRDGAGFTSADLRSHLMSLGEYLCMYLFTWSDVLWPQVAGLPTKEDVETAVMNSKMFVGVNLREYDDTLFEKDRKQISPDIDHLKVFVKTLPKVRRALANIPTYMICDDHDVTDDWNMTPTFTDRVYHKDNGLGLRIVQNALVAYALCQLWGNTPEQFELDSSNKPAAGRQLLTLLDGTAAVDYDANSGKLQTIVGVHTADQLTARKPEALFHDQKDSVTIGGMQVSANSLVYNFTYEGPKHQIIFTDTRSWRSYPHGNDATADFLPPDQLDSQIQSTPVTGDRVLIVVLTTNAPPVQPIRGATRHDTLTTFLSKNFKADAYPDLFDAWEIPSAPFDRLLTWLTNKLGPYKSLDHYGQVTVLSGDVHFSFASRLAYKATKRFWDRQSQPTAAVLAQLVASSFKKQNDDTVGFQRDGYFYVPHSTLVALGQAAGAVASDLVRKDMTEGYVGWSTPQKSPGFTVETSANALSGTAVTSKSPIRAITSDYPTIQVFPLPSSKSVVASSFVDQINLSGAPKPDYRYRLDYLLPSSQALDPSVLPNVPLPPLPPAGSTNSEDRKKAMKVFNEATGHYREHNKKAGTEKLIGRNNIGEITFDWGKRDDTGDHKKVNHTLRWRYSFGVPDNSTPDPEFPDTFVNWTTYTVSLDPNDPNYEDKKATVEGS